MTVEAASGTGRSPRLKLPLLLIATVPVVLFNAAPFRAPGSSGAAGPREAVPAVNARPGIPFNDPLVPDSILAIPSGPTLVLERAEGIPGMGIRVSVPLDPLWPAAGRMLVQNALNRARNRAEAIGAEVWGGVQDGRIAFHVIGDARDSDELAWVVRLLTAEPEATGAAEATARERARLDQLAETPRGRLLLEIESRILGTGAGRTLPAARARDVHDMWRRSYARDRMRIFVLGDLPLSWVLADLSRIGAPPLSAVGTPYLPDPIDLPVPESPLYSWSAAAFTFGPAHDPAVLATVAALRSALRGSVATRAAVNIVEGLHDGSGWLGITARAPRSRDADASLNSALALLTEDGLDASWVHGAATARSDFVASAATLGGWLALSDRYFSPDGTSNARTALNRLDALQRHDLDPVLESFRSSLFHPRIDR